MVAMQMILLGLGGGAGSGDPFYSSVLSLLHFDGADASTTMTDQKGLTWTVNGNAQIDTAQSKFGGSSLLLDGTGDYLETASSTNYNIGTNDYTIECWIRPATVTSLRVIAGRREATGNATGWVFYVNSSGELGFTGYSAPNVPGIALASAASVVALNTWAHVAVTRSGTTWRLFYNGTIVATGTESGNIAGNSRPVQLGRQASATARDFNGHIDDFRITKDVARYTSAFTVPSAAFPDS